MGGGEARVWLVALGLVACQLDTSGQESAPQGGGSSTGEAAASSQGETTRLSESSAGTEQGSGVAGSTHAAEPDSSGGGSTSTGTEGTRPDPSGPWCDPQADLAACYDFAGVGGGTLEDLSGNGNHGSVVGIDVNPGPLGEAATFDDDSEIAVPDSPSLDIPGPLTIEAWVHVDALPLSGRMGVLDNNQQYGVTIHDTDQYRCAMGVSLFGGPVVQGRWSHLACVFDGEAVRMYVDGSELGSLKTTGPLNTDNTDPTSIGDTSPAFAQPLLGAIGGLRVWSTARSPEQLCEAAGGGAPCP